MRWANPLNKITYDDPDRSEHHVFLCGGDIYIALISHTVYLEAQNITPSDQAYFLISDDDLTDLLDIYYGDSRFRALTVEMEGNRGVVKIAGVRIKTPSPKPPGWWPNEPVEWPK